MFSVADFIAMLDERRVANISALLLIVGLLVFAPSLGNEFVWDDEEQVVNNGAIQSLANIPAFFSGSTFQSGGAGGLTGLYYKPLMTLTYALLYAAFSLEPFYYHAVQLLLHLGNTLFIFWLLRKLLISVWSSVAGADIMAGLLALLWLVHPINVESVVYVASMQEVLFFFFGSLALVMVVYGQAWPVWLARSRWLLVSGLLLASLLSKETGVLWLPMTVFYVWLFQRSSLLLSFLVTGGASVVYAVLRFWVAEVFFNKHGLSPITTATFGERLLSIPKIIVHYFNTVLWPQELAIAQHWMVTAATWSDFWLPLLVTVLIVVGVSWWGQYTYRAYRTLWRTWLFFVGWLVIGLGLHLQLFPLDMTVADRWFYFPLVGLLGLFSIGAWQLYRAREVGWRASRVSVYVVVGLLLMVTIGLSVRTRMRIDDWQDGYTLYGHDVMLSPDSFDLQNNYGVELYRQGEYELAEKHFRISTELAPHWWTNWNNLGVSVERKGRLDQAEEYFARAVDHGAYYLAYQNLARLRLQRDPAAAVTFIEVALERLPYNVTLWTYLAVGHVELEQWQEAEQAALRAHELAPSDVTQALVQQVRAQRLNQAGP